MIPSKLKKIYEKNLIGCLNGTGITSKNYKAKMSGECEECGEHCMDCQCQTKRLQEAATFSAAMLAKAMGEAQIRIIFDMLDQLGLVEEFIRFYQNSPESTLEECCVNFARLHPEKLVAAKDLPNQPQYESKCIIFEDKCPPSPKSKKVSKKQTKIG